MSAEPHLGRESLPVLPAVVRILAVGTDDAVATLDERLRRAPQHRRRVVAACTPSGHATVIGGVPVVGDLDAVPRLVWSGRYDAIAVAPSAGWSAPRMRQILPAIAGEDAGPEGLHLLRTGMPASARILKSVLDRTIALLLLLLTAPLLVAIAVALRTDGGPALVRDHRVGARGRTVGLRRFRTAGTVRVGPSLQRHGLDVLPRLLDVLAGSVALVGPRPPAVAEVLGGAARRPIAVPGLIEPGGTERSYLGQWSPALDLCILARAARSACRRVAR